MALFGLLFVLACAVTITEARLARHMARPPAEAQGGPGRLQGVGWDLFSRLLKALFCTPTLVFTYVGSGLQLFTIYAILAWMPSYLNRYHGLAPDKSALVAAVLLMVSAIGMALCGIATDRAGHKSPDRKATLAIVYCLGTCVLLLAGMRMQPGAAQLAVIAAGIFFAAGTWGAAGAMVANLVHGSILSTAFATLTLANNLLGAAPGPYLTGLLADRIGLLGALQFIPLVSVLAALVFALAKANYVRDLRRFEAKGRHQDF
jgi:MFS family permease